jgi:tripartite motif-containing protein 71
MRRILTLLAACGLASGVSIGLSGTIPRPPAVGATGVPATARGWQVLGAARSLPVLSRPAGLAVGARGHVYVADTGNHRIVEIAPDGRPLAHFGDADLRPQGASGLAVSAGGTVYVADAFHRAIRVYSPGHRRIASWPVSIPGESGTPLAVAVGGGGDVIVAIAPENRCTIPYGPLTCATSYLVQRRTSSGRLLGQFRTRIAPFGAPNSVVTQLSVAVNLAGHIYVAVGGTEPCYKDCRVYHFLVEHGPDGRVLGHWGTDELDQTASWTAIATGSRGNIFLADDFNHRIEKRASGGRILGRWPVGPLFPIPLECSSEPLAVWQDSSCRRPSLGPAGVAVARNGTVYLSDPGSGRILVLSSGGRLLAQWGAGGAAPDRFWFPASVALDVRGQLWVDDMANGRVQMTPRGHPADGRFHVRFAVRNPGTGMAVDRQGNVYIGQQLGPEASPDAVVSKFSPSGKLLARWGNLNMVDPPSGIAVAPNGDVVIVSIFLYKTSQLTLNGANILRLSPAGKQLGLIHLGYFGPGPGIAVDAQENITVAYGTPPHFERYSSSGTLLASWGAPKPSLAGEIVPNPAGITLDAAGDVYIADTLQNEVKEYGASGRLLHVWGSAGSYAGQFHHPGGIAVAPDGTIYVSDTENHRVQRLLMARSQKERWKT